MFGFVEFVTCSSELSLHSYRTLSYHSVGPVWAIQQKKELLVSGGQDKLVCMAQWVTGCVGGVAVGGWM